MNENNLHSSFDFISPLDTRYYAADDESFNSLRGFLSERATIAYQLEVEQALLAEIESQGVAPQGLSVALAATLKEKPITPEEVYKEERRIHHNIRALTNCIRERIAPDHRGYVHLFATSNDIMDTARALALRDVTREVLLPDLRALIGVLVSKAREHAATPQIGRTHGRHAVPITLGYWLANYVERLGERTEMLARTASNLRGKLSGAVGGHNSFALAWPDDPAMLELGVLARLGLRSSDNASSSQIVHPEYVADFAHSVVSTFSVLANLADDFRHLMRSEIEEIGEDIREYQVGSSTMPHKINPKNFENVKSLWKAYVPRMTTVYMDQLSEHQRDLTNSASSRFINELVAGFSYSVKRLRKAVAGTVVNTTRLAQNFAKGGEVTVAEPLYIALALSGREDAYDLSKVLVESCREQGLGLQEYLKTGQADSVLDLISPSRRKVVLDPTQYLGDCTDRTRLVCDDWWGDDPLSGRVNPIDRLQKGLRRPDPSVALVAKALSADLVAARSA